MKIPSGGVLLFFFIQQHISHRAIQNTLEKQLDPFSRGSIPVFLWKPIATCDFPWGSRPRVPSPGCAMFTYQRTSSCASYWLLFYFFSPSSTGMIMDKWFGRGGGGRSRPCIPSPGCAHVYLPENIIMCIILAFILFLLPKFNRNDNGYMGGEVWTPCPSPWMCPRLLTREHHHVHHTGFYFISSPQVQQEW